MVFSPAASQFVKDGLIHEIKDLTRAQISGFSYELYDANDLFSVAEEIEKKLHLQIFPTLNQLASVAGIDNFFYSHPGWSVSILSLNNMTCELISAKLKKSRDFEVVFRKMVSLIKDRIANY